MHKLFFLILLIFIGTITEAQIRKDTLVKKKEIKRPVVHVGGKMEPDSTLIEVAQPLFKIGGALRFNYFVKDWVDANKKKGGDFNYDMFRLNVVGEFRRLLLSAEYRFYSKAFGGGMLKNGWMGYAISPQDEIQLGLHQVPFGNQVYNSDNWFFNITYYLGLEDDYDVGVKFIHAGMKIRYVLAYYKNSEYPPGNYSRYSYDVVGINEETNQFNAKISYLLPGTRLSFSAQCGQLYNHLSGDFGRHDAYALHLRSDFKRWTLKLQALTFIMHPANPDSITDKTISMGAYNAAYQVATAGEVYTLSLAYHVPVNWGAVSRLKFYNNYSYFDKSDNAFHDSQMNVLGCLLTAGKIYTYIDWAAGLNHPWLGPDYSTSLAEGTEDAPWHYRFNINFGYYF